MTADRLLLIVMPAFVSHGTEPPTYDERVKTSKEPEQVGFPYATSAEDFDKAMDADVAD